MPTEIFWNETGINEFVCFAKHCVNGQVFLIFNLGESTYAMPFLDEDIFTCGR